MILLVNWENREVYNSESEKHSQWLREDFEDNYSWEEFLQDKMDDYAHELITDPVGTVKTLQDLYEDAFVDWINNTYDRVEID